MPEADAVIAKMEVAMMRQGWLYNNHNAIMKSTDTTIPAFTVSPIQDPKDGDSKCAEVDLLR